VKKRWFKKESFILVFIMTLTILAVCWNATAKPLDLEHREYFMYASWGKKIYLGVIKNEFVVQFKEGVIQEQIENLNAKYQTGILKTFNKDGNHVPIYLLRISKERSLQDVYGAYGSEEIVSWTMPAFHHLNTRIIPTDEFKVQLSSSASENALMQLNQAHGVEIVVRDENEPSYLLRVTEQSDLNSLDMANLYHEQPFIDFAAPDYLSNQEIEDAEARQYFRYYDITPLVHFQVSPDEFVVQFKKGVTDAQIDALNARYNIQIIRKFSRGIDGITYILNMPPGKRLKDVLKLCGKQQAPRPDIYGYEEIVEWTMPSFYSHEQRLIPTDSFSVMLKPGVDESVLREFNRKHEVVENTIRSFNLRRGRVYALMVTEESGLNSLDMANLYHEQPFIQDSFPSYLSGGLYSLPSDYPNDYYYRENPQQWNLNQASDIDIDAPEAWRIWDNIGDGKGWGITIAIVDTGIEMYHEDLAGKLLTPDEDFVTWDGWPQDEDPSRHGTQVAGIAAAVTNNSVGIAGVAPNALIMPLRAMKTLVWEPEPVGQAIEFAYEHDARVINCSFGSPNNYSQVRHAVEEASAEGSVVICAAGNEGTAFHKDIDYFPLQVGNTWRILIGRKGALLAGDLMKKNHCGK
jgi:hypothetical protein